MLAKMLRDEIWSLKRESPGHAFVERDAEAVKIGGDAQRRAGDLLRRHIG